MTPSDWDTVGLFSVSCGSSGGGGGGGCCGGGNGGRGGGSDRWVVVELSAGTD